MTETLPLSFQQFLFDEEWYIVAIMKMMILMMERVLRVLKDGS